MANIKTDVLTIAEFQQNRPDMVSYSDNEIQSAINQTAIFLNATCNGLISKVWGVEDNTSPLYRNEDEKEYIKEAFIIQTQYTLNLGNDFTVGSESFSTGSFNTSIQRPEGRDTIAPGVLVLLQAARVYAIQSFEFQDKGTCYVESNGELNEDLTVDKGDIRYVQKYQPNANEGSVAVIGQGNLVNFADPKTIPFNVMNADNILDPSDNQYKAINRVLKLLFIGKDNYGTYSGMERGEIIEMIQQYSFVWNEFTQYKRGQVVNYYDRKANKLVTYLCIADNVGKEPPLNTDAWMLVESIPFDVSEVTNTVEERVNKRVDAKFVTIENDINTRLQKYEDDNIKFKEEVKKIYEEYKQEIDTLFNDYKVAIQEQLMKYIQVELPNAVVEEVKKQLDLLPTIGYEQTVFYAGQHYFFETLKSFEAFVEDWNQKAEQYNDRDVIGPGDWDTIVNSENYLLAFGILGREIGKNGFTYSDMPYKSWSFGLKDDNCWGNMPPGGETAFAATGYSSNVSSTSIYFRYGFNNVDLTRRRTSISSSERTGINHNNDNANGPGYVNYGEASWSYGGSSTQDHKHRQKELFVVKFLYDIKIRKRGVFKQESTSAKWGEITGNIKNQKDLQVEFDSVREEIKTKTTWGQITGLIGNQSDLTAWIIGNASITAGNLDHDQKERIKEIVKESTSWEDFKRRMEEW